MSLPGPRPQGPASQLTETDTVHFAEHDELELKHAAPPSAWERAVPWLMRLGLTLKWALNSGAVLMGWRSLRGRAAS